MRPKHFFLPIVFFGAGITAYAQNLTLQPDGTAGKDALIRNTAPTLNMATHQSYEAEAWTAGGAFVSRGLIAFDLSSLPAGCIITDARLSLYYTPQGDGDPHSALSGSNAFVLNRITEAWDESTVNWNNQPATTTVNEVVLAAPSSTTQDYPDIDVTAMTQDVIDASGTELGIMLSLQTEQYYRRVVFGSSDYSNASKRPKLEITYTGLGLGEQTLVFDVYPNPCDQVLHIGSGKDAIEGTTIGIYDLSGKLVQTVPFSETISVVGLTAGTYFVKIGNAQPVRFMKS